MSRSSPVAQASSSSSPFVRLLARFAPAPVGIQGRERWRAVIGAAVGVLLAAVLCRLFAGPEAAHGPMMGWLVAPLGASAVLVFAVPSSPLAQPWAVVGGTTLSALVGIACAIAIPDPAVAAAVAVAAALGLMLQLRCLHPPGGAAALLMVITHTTNLRFALFPVLLNALLLVVLGVIYNSLTGRPYPRAPGATTAGSRFTAADLDAALRHYDQVLDISRDDLHELLEHAEAAAYQRHLGALRCADVMTRAPFAVQPQTLLGDAWAALRQRKIKALPVVDAGNEVVGIVTTGDFMRLAKVDRHQGLRERLRAVLRVTRLRRRHRPQTVGEIMTREVRVAQAELPLAELIPAFAEGSHHHVPIVDAQRRLVGILTQTDLVRALYRAVRP